MIVFRCCVRALFLGLLVVPTAAAAETQNELILTLKGDAWGRPTTTPWRAIAGEDPNSRLRIALAVDQAGFLRNVWTSAALRVDVPLVVLEGGAPLGVRDASSWVAVTYEPSASSVLKLYAFPFDTDYVRLGHLHALDWGGTNVARRESSFLQQQGGAPGALLALGLPRIRLFVGGKWANQVSRDERLWAVFGGGSWEPAAALRFDLGFGYFERPKGEPDSAQLLEGVSGRVVWRAGPSEPELALEPLCRPSFAREALSLFPRDEPAGTALALEGALLATRSPLLESPLEARLVPAPAAALYGSWQRRSFRAHFALWWRSLRFVLRNERAVLPVDSTSSVERAELGAWLGGGWTLTPLMLTPAVEAGVQLPAALDTVSAVSAQSFVTTGAGLAPLPPGAARLPLVATRVSLRWQLSRVVALLAFGDYVRDPNATRFSPTNQREFAPADAVTLAAGARARF